MGEPLEAVEGSDSEISRLFPKCRPRSANHTPTTTPIDTRRSDLNLNCVLDSDDNENYDTEHITGDIPRIYDNSKLSRDSGSSGRMSVDSGSGSRSGSTPGSRSGSTPGSHSESIKMERSAEDVDMDMDVSVVSAYDDYDERYMRSSVLDSSYEETPPPPPATRTQAPRRDHFRLRDSRIEIAGGREVFSQSRSRPARRRHDESQRRGAQQSHRQQYQQERQQQEQPWPESPGDSEGHGGSSSVVESPLVYETRLAGSSEVVFDDIGEWVARGLTVRALDERPGSPSSPTADQQGDHAEHGDQGYLAAYERSTSPSDSDSTQSSPQKVTKIGNVPIAEYEGSPRRYGPRPSPRTHSPRGNHHGPPPRPPRPGFPRRVLAEDEVAREATTEPLPSNEGSAVPQGSVEEEAVAPLEETTSDPPPPDSCSEAESVSPAPPVIAISTLTSSYSNQTSEPEPNAVDSDMYDYSYEMSETRKVLEEFFKEQGGGEDEFLDLEYHLKRQQGNSYVGLRLAAENSEDQAAEGNDQQLDQGVSNSDLDPNKNDPEQNSGTDNANDSSDQHINVSEQQCRSSEQHANGSPPAVNAEHDSEHNTSTYEVSPASPHLLNYQHDLSYEAQQDSAQDHTLEIMSNCSNASISSTYSGVGAQENLQDSVSENLPDFNNANSGLYDKLNEVVAAALGRDSFMDSRSVEDHTSTRSCPEDPPSQEDPGLGLLDISTEGEHDTASTNPETEDLPDPEVGLQQVGHSRNFTLSPETTSCDSGEVESECSGVDPEGSIHSSSRGLCTAMPVLEDGLSSGDESGMEEPEEEEDENKEILYEEPVDEMSLDLQQQQRPMVRSLDEQLCRGELPPLNPLPTLNSHNSPLPNAASSPHAKVRSRNSTHTNTQSPSSSTLTLMKKQITEIEREIALRRPEGGPRRCGLEGDGPPPHLDLHLLDPLNEKVAEPPPPPAPHPHRGASSGKSQIVENGSSPSTPNQMPTTAVSPSHVLGHLHSPQYTPVSGPSTGPHLLSAMGSLTSPVQHKVAPHMVPGHPASHDILHNQGVTGGGVSQSRESVEAAIADIKQAIRRTKNLPIKSHPQDRSPINDKAPVWIPRNNSSRRDPQQPPLPGQQQQGQASNGQQSQPQSPQSTQIPQQQQSQQQQLEAAVGEATQSPEHVTHEDGEWRRRPLHTSQDDGDTDQETDRLLGQQRSDDPGFYDEKIGGLLHVDPSELAALEKEKESNKKKGRSKEVLIEGVLFRARYLGSTQLVSEGQPTKTTRMMQAEEAVSRIKDADDDDDKEALTESHDPVPSPGPPHSPSPQDSPVSQSSPGGHIPNDSHSPREYAIPGGISPREQNCSLSSDSPRSKTSRSRSSPRCQESFHTSPRIIHSPRYPQSPPEIRHTGNTTAWKPIPKMSTGIPTCSACSYMTDVSTSHTIVAPLPPGVLEEPIETENTALLALSETGEPVRVTVGEEEFEVTEEVEDDGDDNEVEEEDEEEEEVEEEEEEEEDEEEEEEEEEEEARETDQLQLQKVLMRSDDALKEAHENLSSDSEDQCIEVLTVIPGASGTTTLEETDEGLEVDVDGVGSLEWVSEESGGPGLGPAGTVFHLRLVGSVDVAEESGKAPARKTTTFKRPKKDMVMEAVAHLKALAPDGEAQPSTEVDLFISTEKIMVLNTDLKEIMMDHALRTISYIADIGDLVVLMARRRVLPTDDTGNNIQKTPKMICHVFESDEAQFIAQSIGQAFQVAYLEFLKANGIEDHSFVKEMDYQEVLNSQEIFGDELQMFAKKELQKEVVVPKMKSEILGVVVVESGWGSMVPTVVIANLSPTGAAAKCGQLNIGDQIIAINGVSLVGLPLSTCQNYIKNTKYNTAVKLTVVPCPPVVEVKIRRPDTKYQLGFSVQNGVICSLLRGGIAERGGVRVGHRIIDINSQSVVAVPHEKIVNLLATSVGEIRMKTMPTSIFRLLTGQETPQYI